jgi:PAS domain S-box-containing protein
MHAADICLANVRILVVEDEPACRDAVRVFLESSGAEVTAVSSAEDALGLFSRDTFDAIITDLRLGGMDGISLLRQVRSEGGSVPVIIMTGYASMQSAIAALQLGADDYIAKPITSQGSIVRAARNAIDKVQLRTQNAILRGKLEESELCFRTVFDHTAEMILSFSIDSDGAPGRLEQCNSSAIRAIGYSGNTLRQMTILDMLARSHRKNADRIIRSLANSEASSFDTLFVTASGTSLHAEASCHKLASCSPAKVIMIARNISELVAAETGFANTLEDERAQMGRELHDVVCQDIASIAMLAGTQPGSGDMDLIRSAASSAMRSARSLAKGLVPVFEDSEELRVAVADLLQAQAERHGIECMLDMQTPLNISGANATIHLFRIIQEAVNNAIRHANADSIAVRLASDDGIHTLTVRNSGAPPARKGNGMGTLIMRQRARILGASLSITHEDEGTSVKCCWQNGENERT